MIFIDNILSEENRIKILFLFILRALLLRFFIKFT